MSPLSLPFPSSALPPALLSVKDGLCGKRKENVRIMGPEGGNE